MSIEIAGITLNRVHRLATLESVGFAGHRVAGLQGTVFQDTGRHSTRLLVEGIYYGEKAKEDLEKLRDVYKKQKESDFLAEIVGQAYFSQVVIDRFEVFQNASEPEQFSFRMVLAEYIPPPQPVAGLELSDVDEKLALDAKNFMDMIELPDLLSVPDFGNPTTPLKSILDGVGSALGGAAHPAAQLAEILGSNGSSKAASLPLEGKIASQVNPEKVVELIQKQLSRLLSAGQSAGKTLDDSGSLIGTAERYLTGLVPPGIDRSTLLEQGFSSIQKLMPADISKALDGFDGKISTFFDGLQADLLAPLGGILENYRCLQNLGIGAETGSTPLKAAAPIHTSISGSGSSLISRDVQPSTTTFVDEFLVMLPDPLDARALLNFFYEQLASLDRESVPLQNLPVYDELRDKLETALEWLKSDGNRINAHYVQTLTAFATYIHNTFHEKSIGPLVDSITFLQSQVNIAELKHHLEAVTAGFNQLAGQVNNGSLSGSADAITELATHVNALKTIAPAIQTHWIQTTGKEFGGKLAIIDDTLEERMAELLLLGAPSTDLAIISMAVQPLNKLFETLGIGAFISGIQELGNMVTSLLNNLNLAQISREIQKVLDDAIRAIQTFSKIIIDVTLELTHILDRVKQAIESLGVAELVEELKGLLESFEKEVVDGLNSVYGPVKKLLSNAFSQLNELLAAFDPGKIVQEVVNMLQVLTNILGDPALQEIIKTIRGTLETVNNSLDEFRFNTVTDPVVSGIGVVKDAFGIIGSLPLPDSVGEKVNSALKILPKSEQLNTFAGKLETGFGEMVENPKNALLDVKDKPADLVKLVEEYAPEKFLGDKFSAPYQEFVAKVEEMQPTKLMAPVKTAMDKFLNDLRQTVDPSNIFNALQEPYQALYNALDGLNPAALIQPLQDKLTEGIRAITKQLPTDAADEIFSVIDSIASKIRDALDYATTTRDALTALDNRLSGLINGESQVRQWGDEIAAKLDSLTDFNSVSSALQAVEAAVNDIQSAPLQQALFPPLDNLLAALRDLDPQNRLIAMVQAKQAFPLDQLNKLLYSSEKQDLLILMNNFNPMDSLFTGPLGGMQDQLKEWEKSRKEVTNFFNTSWQERYFKPGGPLSCYKKQSMTLSELKTQIIKTIREQLTDTIAPVFLVIENLQTLISAVIGEISTLITGMEAQAESLLHVTETLSGLREVISFVVEQLNKLDIKFIATEIKEVFDTVKSQLEAINPQHLSEILKATFDHVLDALQPDSLLGLKELDELHKILMELLRARDPKVILINTVQPEYDKISGFLKLFDIGTIIETFLECIEGLQTQLKEELDRVKSAYGDMTDAIPSSFKNNLGQSFQTN